MNVTILFIYSKWRVLGIIQDRNREPSVLMRCEPSFFNFYVFKADILQMIVVAKKYICVATVHQ